MKKKIIITLIVLLAVHTIAFAVDTNEWKEADYRDYLNETFFIGETEIYITGQYLYVDIVAWIRDTDHPVGVAIEVDYAKKNTESIGQALIYADILGMTPGIVLIKSGSSEDTINRRIRQTLDAVVAFDLPIIIWTVDEDGYIERIH